MNEKPYILGRGKVHFAGRYVGESSKIDIVRKMYGYALHIDLGEITDENLALLQQSNRESFEVFFEADNPVGDNIDFTFPAARIVAGGLPLKGNEWMSISLQLKLKPGTDGAYFKFSRRPPKEAK